MIRNSQIRTIPDSIGQLFKLQVLSFPQNRLQVIPNSLGQLVNLEQLDLSLNSLQAIPDSIGQLVNLEQLNLYWNSLRAIPDSIGQLVNLEQLNLTLNSLQAIPDSIGQLVNLEQLNLSRNSLRAIPECLYRLPASCLVSLEGNPLSRQVIEQARARINAEGYRGPRFIFSVHEERQTFREHSLNAVLPEWCEDTCKQILLNRLSLAQRSNLANWLARLKGTADYRIQERAVKDKVKGLLAWLAEETDENSLQLAHQILADATSTCGDRVALSLNTFSLHVKLCKSGNLSLLGLKQLIIGSDRYDRLSKIAEQKCQQLRAVDPIEVHLCYQIHLKDVLGLPIEANNMLYEQLSSVTQEDIDSARQQILEETGPDQQLSFLLENPIWKKSLESSERFDQIKQLCGQQKEEVVSQLDTTDLEALQQFEQEFQEKEKTVWDTCYVLTKQILEDSQN